MLKIENFNAIEKEIKSYLDEHGYLPPDLPRELIKYFILNYREQLTYDVIGMNKSQDQDKTYHFYAKNNQGKLFDIELLQIREYEYKTDALFIEEIEELPEMQHKSNSTAGFITTGAWSDYGKHDDSDLNSLINGSDNNDINDIFVCNFMEFESFDYTSSWLTVKEEAFDYEPPVEIDYHYWDFESTYLDELISKGLLEDTDRPEMKISLAKLKDNRPDIEKD